MQFFSSAIDTLQTLVVALGAGLGVWGVVNLLEGYGSDNPGSKSQGMKQLMAGGGIILLIAIIAICVPLIVPKTMGYQLYTVVSGSMEPGRACPRNPRPPRATNPPSK